MVNKDDMNDAESDWTNKIKQKLIGYLKSLHLFNKKFESLIQF